MWFHLEKNPSKPHLCHIFCFSKTYIDLKKIKEKWNRIKNWKTVKAAVLIDILSTICVVTLSTEKLLENKDTYFSTSITKQSFVTLPKPRMQIGCHLKMTLTQLCLLVGIIPCVFSMKKVNSPKWGGGGHPTPQKTSYMVTWCMSSVSRRTDTGQTEILLFAYHSLNTQIMFIRLREKPMHSAHFF